MAINDILSDIQTAQLGLSALFGAGAGALSGLLCKTQHPMPIRLLTAAAAAPIGLNMNSGLSSMLVQGSANAITAYAAFELAYTAVNALVYRR
jgi:hypothetical protein